MSAPRFQASCFPARSPVAKPFRASRKACPGALRQRGKCRFRRQMPEISPPPARHRADRHEKPVRRLTSGLRLGIGAVARDDAGTQMDHAQRMRLRVSVADFLAQMLGQRIEQIARPEIDAVLDAVGALIGSGPARRHDARNVHQSLHAVFHATLRDIPGAFHHHVGVSGKRHGFAPAHQRHQMHDGILMLDGALHVFVARDVAFQKRQVRKLGGGRDAVGQSQLVVRAQTADDKSRLITGSAGHEYSLNVHKMISKPEAKASGRGAFGWSCFARNALRVLARLLVRRTTGFSPSAGCFSFRLASASGFQNSSFNQKTLPVVGR